MAHQTKPPTSRLGDPTTPKGVRNKVRQGHQLEPIEFFIYDEKKEIDKTYYDL
jgi:hypothetical protein